MAPGNKIAKGGFTGFDFTVNVDHQRIIKLLTKNVFSLIAEHLPDLTTQHLTQLRSVVFNKLQKGMVTSECAVGPGITLLRVGERRQQRAD